MKQPSLRSSEKGSEKGLAKLKYMEEKEVLSAMILSRVDRFHPAALVELYERAGSATAVMEHRNDIRDIIPEASRSLVDGLRNIEEAERRAEAELEYDKKHNISVLTIGDARYPQRLKECADAPLVLYYLGNSDLNARHTINIVGTRHCTRYGQELIERFVGDLKQFCPDVLIFSGLAYGVDICAHRAALHNDFATVGVVAHGLDEIYPRAHRETAVEMLSQGGLLTEYMTHTEPFAKNFVSRNRIVAGCSDATVLVESAAKGGGLITCSIAMGYGRDVFAFPGAVGARYSEGCNNLIRDNRAALITSAEDFVKAMGWNTDERRQKALAKGIERDLFPDLSAEEKAVVEALSETNDLLLNELTVKTSLSVGRLMSLLFELELKGIVKPYAGGIYHLVSV